MIKILVVIFILFSSVSSDTQFNLCQQCLRSSEVGNQTTNPQGDGGDIGCTITRNNCSFNPHSEDGEPEPPTQQNSYLCAPFIKSITGNDVVLDVNFTFSPPQNMLISWVDGFKITFLPNNQSVNICLGRKLTYKRDAATLLNFDCFTELMDDLKILPERYDYYYITVQTIYRQQLSDPIDYTVRPLKCKRNPQLLNSSLCEPEKPKAVIATIDEVEDKSNPIPMVIVALFLVFTLIVVAAVLKRPPKLLAKLLRTTTHQSLPPDVQYEQQNPPVADEPITEKPVLIYVCDPEQEEVRTFVVYLINFLRRDLCVDAECNLFDEEAEVNYSRWLENKLKEDKKVLVIWSPLSRARWERQDSYDPFLPLLYQMKSQMILNPKHTQLASATFKCLRGDQCVPEIFRNFTPIFYLPENIELLYFWLQGKEMFLPDKEIIISPLNDDNFKNTEYGLNLKASYDRLMEQSGAVMEWYEQQIQNLSDEDDEKDNTNQSVIPPDDIKPSMSTYYGDESSYIESEVAQGDGKATLSTYYGDESSSFNPKPVPCTYDDSKTGSSTYYGESTVHSLPQVKVVNNLSTYYGEESSFQAGKDTEAFSDVSKDYGTYYGSESSDEDVGPCTEDGICAHCTKIRMLEERAMESDPERLDSIHFTTTHNKSDISISVMDSSDDEENFSVQSFDCNENDALC